MPSTSPDGPPRRRTGIGRIVFSVGLTFDEIQTFVRCFAAKGSDFYTVAANMQREGVTRIRIVRQGNEEFEKPQDPVDDDDGPETQMVVHGEALTAIKGIAAGTSVSDGIKQALKNLAK